jgi:hypothetical protein
VAAKLFAIIAVLTSATIVGTTVNGTTTFTAEENCDMGKKKIENALNVKRKVSAVWDQKTKHIPIYYNPKRIQLDDIHRPINETGYNTDKFKAPEDVYKKLTKSFINRSAENESNDLFYHSKLII